MSTYEKKKVIKKKKKTKAKGENNSKNYHLARQLQNANEKRPKLTSEILSALFKFLGNV